MITIQNKDISFIRLFTITSCFSFALLMLRIVKTSSPFFLFLVWNLFLASIPYFITLLLKTERLRKNKLFLIIGFTIWLAFLPNAPYIVTDLQHIRISSLDSIWFDVLLLLSFAINGLIIGFAALKNMQEILRHHLPKKIITIATYIIFLLCGFGVYLGRVLRWNSWDIMTNPLAIVTDISRRIIYPISYINTWGFTICFGTFLILLYHITSFLNNKQQ
ncbi:DUF1361 domain-containing protein [Aquimarina hainanensis]|uniref:DUF1361 domain-containing protein n=1 Tax=Aquimarina hainanensis TaxID=1578017 RepID=A0ABW5N967_9FLAO|nr:DUF1361 domain-containing protein [Aquimarina sp. TRL1]QKX05608.1 DUF1361 domain-containing protein [Aquimarina sp. TRL1]